MALPSARTVGPHSSIGDRYARSRIFFVPPCCAAGIPRDPRSRSARSARCSNSASGWTTVDDRGLSIAEDAESLTAACVNLFTNCSRCISQRNGTPSRRKLCSPLAVLLRKQQGPFTQAKVHKHPLRNKGAWVLRFGIAKGKITFLLAFSQ